MENPNKRITLDPSNPEHQVLMKKIVSGDTLDLAASLPQRVLTSTDLENIRAAEEKRARKALKLK